MVMTSLLGESVTLVVNFSNFADQLNNVDLVTTTFTVVPGAEVSALVDYTFTSGGFPQRLLGTITVDVTDSGFVVGFSGTQQAGGLSFRIGSVADESAGSVTSASQTASSGMMDGVNMTLAPGYGSADGGFVSGGFNLLGYQPDVSLSQTVAFELAEPTAPPAVTINTGSSLDEGGLHVLGSPELQATDIDTAAANLLYRVTSATTNGTLFLDSDGDGVVDTGEARTANRTFTQADINEGRVKYLHNGGETTADSFSFSLTDGNDTVTGNSFAFTVAAVNDAPAVLASETIGTTEDVASAITGISFSDPDAGVATVIASLSVTSGTLAATSADDVAVAGSGTGTITLSGSIAAINAFIAASGVTFTTATNATSNVTLTAAISDDGNAGAGGSLTDSTTTTLEVTGVDDPTDAAGDAFTTTDAGIVSGSVFADNGSGADSDPDSLLIITAVNGSALAVNEQLLLASGALVTVNADGTFDYDPNGQFEYLPVGSSADDSFIYAVNGVPATVTISIEGIDNADLVEGTEGNDSLRGGLGNDTVFGYGSIDLLYGDEGDDLLDSGAGDDLLEGGAGADTLTGGDGIDVAWYETSATGVTVNLGTGTGMGGDAEGDVLFGIENIYGSVKADTLTGNIGTNALGGGAGNDTIFGEAGNDTLYGDEGDDFLQGNIGNDLIYGAIGNDDLRGGQDNDTVYGEDGNDILYGAVGNDLLIGGIGADTLIGGEGNDTASYLESVTGVTVDLLLGIATGGNATGDVLSGIENLIGSTANDALIGSNEVNTLFGRGGNDTIYGNSGNDSLYGDEGDDFLQGNLGDDLIQGDVGNDDIRGGQGNDTIFGGENNDLIYGAIGNDDLRGGQGNDTIYGGAGNDIFYGALGNDVMIGDEGADRFVFSTSTALGDVDLVLGFEHGVDSIVLAKSVFTAFAISPVALGDHLRYEIGSGGLYYDADGAGGLDEVQFATVFSSDPLTSSDFLLL